MAIQSSHIFANRSELTPGTFIETSMPVVDYYRKQDKVVEIDSSPSVEQVYTEVRRAVEARLHGDTTPARPQPSVDESAESDHPAASNLSLA